MNPLTGFLIVIILAFIGIGYYVSYNVGVSQGVTRTVIITATPTPYQNKVYADLKYDVKHICLYDSQNSNNAKEFDKWASVYFNDQKKVESRGLSAPDYGALSQVVGAPC